MARLRRTGKGRVDEHMKNKSHTDKTGIVAETIVEQTCTTPATDSPRWARERERERERAMPRSWWRLVGEVAFTWHYCSRGTFCVCMWARNALGVYRYRKIEVWAFLYFMIAREMY